MRPILDPRHTEGRAGEVLVQIWIVLNDGQRGLTGIGKHKLCIFPCVNADRALRIVDEIMLRRGEFFTEITPRLQLSQIDLAVSVGHIFFRKSSADQSDAETRIGQGLLGLGVNLEQVDTGLQNQKFFCECR